MQKQCRGWCWGVCAFIIEHLESPMMKTQLIRVESCVQAFSNALGAMMRAKFAIIETLALQKMQNEVPKLYRDPPCPFSMWSLEIGTYEQNTSLSHAIITRFKRIPCF